LIEFAINSAKSAATGHSPFFLNYGQHPRTPAALATEALLPATLSPVADDYLQQLKTAWTCAHQCILAAQAKMKERADQHRRPNPFQVGDEVLLSNKVLRLADTTDRKLQDRFSGPYVAKALRGDNAVALELAPGKPIKTFNVSNLKKWKDPNEHFSGRDYALPGPDLINEEEYFPIAAFARNRWVRSQGTYKEQFHVRWEGYPPSANEWLDVAPMEASMEPKGFTELLNTLKKRLPMPVPKPKKPKPQHIIKTPAAASGPAPTAPVTRSRKKNTN
jgi:hypothetical protein